MLDILQQIQSIFLAIGILFTSLFATGLPTLKVRIPDTEPGEYGQWVNPFIGTGGYPWVGGNMYPGATAPFGVVKLSPDSVTPGGTNLFNWANAGYHYGDTYLLGFSHTRLSGTGARDMGHFRVTPGIGDTSALERLSKPLIFSHDDEVATAGYYAVYLSGIRCLAELTATEHVGAHRYTFDTNDDALLFLDATSFLYDGRAFDGKIEVNPDTGLITGEALVDTQFTGRYGGLRAYFAAKLSCPYVSCSFWENGEFLDGAVSAAGDDCGVSLNLGNRKNQPVELMLGISFVSTENALENLEAEAGGLDFEGVRAKTRDTWDSYLSRIDIESDSDEVKTVFYTALYHSMLMPATYTDVNGEYLGFKNTVGTADDFTYRSDMSLWDTFRTTHPLYILIAPEIQRDCLKSLVAMAKTGGSLPRWPSGGGYTCSMFGTPADMVIAESYLKGITDFDVESAYQYMVQGSDSPSPEYAAGRNAVNEYNTYNYVPADVTTRSVSYTLEYCWADASIALLASALGKSADAERFTAKSLWYKNLFDSETKYFRPRNSDGSWAIFDPSITSFYDEVLPVKLASAYTEGSARHWRWTAVQDTEGLIELFGGNDYFVSELNQFMADASADLGSIDPGTGYWIGNEHDLHTAYLFNDAGSPELTQKWVRWTLSERFKNDTAGLDGNEDGGALSSWYVWSAMGLYPVAGTDRYWIGSPNLCRADVNMGNGNFLHITALNQSAENIYVQSVTLNGNAVTSPFLIHSDIADGGELIFTMGSEPAENGGF